MPFAFPPVKLNGYTLTDGGTAWNLDIYSAIYKCRELVGDDSKIVLDVIDIDKILVFLGSE